MNTTGTPCKSCKHRDKLTVENPCYFCISNEDIIMARINPNRTVDFVHYEPIDGKESTNENHHHDH